jgi:hypothetical protein
MANKIDLVLEQGEDFSLTRIWKDTDKQPIPMNGWSAVLEIKEALHLSPELTLTNGNGITLGVSDGSIEIEITKEQIDALSFRSGIYHLVLTDVLSVPRMFSRGTVSIIEE